MSFVLCALYPYCVLAVAMEACSGPHEGPFERTVVMTCIQKWSYGHGRGGGDGFIFFVSGERQHLIMAPPVGVMNIKLPRYMGVLGAKVPWTFNAERRRKIMPLHLCHGTHAAIPRTTRDVFVIFRMHSQVEPPCS